MPKCTFLWRSEDKQIVLSGGTVFVSCGYICVILSLSILGQLLLEKYKKILREKTEVTLQHWTPLPHCVCQSNDCIKKEQPVLEKL